MPRFKIETDQGDFLIDAERTPSETEAQAAIQELKASGGAGLGTLAGEAPPERTWGQTIAGGAIRIGSTIAGGTAGELLNPLGGAIPGAMVGAGLGDVAARYLTGEPQDLRESAIQAGLAAIPATPLAGVAASAVTTAGRVGLGAIEGSFQGALQTAAHSLLSTGDLPSAGELGAGTVGGAAFGAVTHGVFGKLRPPATPNEQVEHAAGHQIMGETTVSPPTIARAAPGAAPEAAGEAPRAPIPPEDATVATARLERMIERVDDVYMHATPEERAVLKQTIRENPDEMMAQTRGVLPLAEIEGMASKIAIDPEEVVPPGTVVNTEHLAQQRAVTNVTAARVVNAKAKLDLDPESSTLQAGVTRAWQQAVNANMVFEGYASEYGRGLGYLSHLRRAGLTPEAGKIARITKFAKGIRTDVTAQEISAAVSRAGDDPNRIYRELMNLGKPTYKERFRGYFLANLMTSPLTFERNAFGNMINLAKELATKPLAVGLDVARAGLTGQARTTYAGEIPAMMAGARKAVPDAYRAFFQVMKQGFTNEDAIHLVDGTGLKGEVRTAFAEAPGPLKYVSRTLEATDRFFKLVSVGMHKDALAIAEASKVAAAEVKAGTLAAGAVKKRIAALAADYGANTDLVPGMTQAIEDAANRTIFREHEAGFLQKTARSVNQWPIVGPMIAPFIVTPFNILRQGFQLSPAGFLMKGAVMGGREGAQRIAETALGTLMLGGLVKLAAEGRLSGTAPSGAGARDAYLAKQPENSIRFGDTWYRFTDLGPLNIVLSAVANFHEAFRRAGQAPTGKDAVDLFEQIQSGLAKTGKSLFQQSFFTGFADIIDAVTDESGDKWARYLSRRVVSTVPFQGLGRVTNAVLDPTQRRPTTIEQGLRAVTPGLAETVPARLDAFGQPMRKETSGARALLIPEAMTRTEDPVRTELAKFKIEPKPSDSRKSLTMGTRTLIVDDASDVAIRQAKGMLRHAALARTVGSGYYARAKPATQERLLRAALDLGQTDLMNKAKAWLRQGRTFTAAELAPPFARSQ